MTVELDGVTLRVDEEIGAVAGSYTALEAKAVGPSRLEIVLDGGRSPTSGEPGLERLELADRSLHRRFRVYTSDRELARLWLDDALGQRFTGAEAYTVTLAEGAVRASRLGFDSRPEELRGAMTGVVGLARRGRELLSSWTGLAEQLGGTVRSLSEGWEPGGVNPIALERVGVKVRLDVSRRAIGGQERLWTVGRAERAPSAARVALLPLGQRPDDLGLELEDELSPGERLRLWTDDRSGAEQLLNPPVQAQIDALAPALVLSPKDHPEVEVLLEGIVFEGERLDRLAELSATLASASPSVAGPYR